MKSVNRIISNNSIGHTKSGDHWMRCEVEYTDGSTGVLYRLDNHDGHIYGLLATHPVIVRQYKIVSLFQEIAA